MQLNPNEIKNKVFEYKYDFDKNGTYISILVPFFIKDEKINNNLLRRNIIVDIRSIDSDIIFLNYKDFQEKLLSSYFYNDMRNTSTPANIRLYFLYKDNNKYINNFNILYDKDYALKFFIKERDLSNIKEGNTNITTKKDKIVINDKKIDLDNFNLIYGLNGSGKTRMLQSISSLLNVPLFNLNIFKGVYLRDSVDCLNNLKYIIDYCDINKIPLLMDDIFWNSFDFRNSIKIVDDLYDYSLKNKVIVTGCNDSTKSLIKAYTHNPNVINI